MPRVTPRSHWSPSWALTPVPTAPQGGKGPRQEDLGDEPVAKATPGARVAVGKTPSPGNTVSWTHLTGKRSEAGQHPTCRPVPGAPGGWEPRPLLCLTCYSSPHQALLCGKGTASSRAPGVGPERKNHTPEILCRDVPQRRGPRVALPVPRLSQRHNKGEPWVARRGLHGHSCGKQIDALGTRREFRSRLSRFRAGRIWEDCVSSCSRVTTLPTPPQGALADTGKALDTSE